MKKIVKLSLCVITLLVVMMFSYYSIKAKSDKIEFQNLSFSSEKIRDNGEIKVKITFEFLTDEEIIITRISSDIIGQSEEDRDPSYDCRKVNHNGKNMYQYTLVYQVEFWQIGTMNLDIYYLDNNFQENVNNFYIPGGKWLSNEISLKESISFGILFTGLIGLGTYIIIENSKKGYFDSEN